MHHSLPFIRCVAALSFLLSIATSAHEVGAPFSGAILDPLVLHHAHIENEQRLNFFGLRRVEGFDDPKRNGVEAELELGWSNSTFDYGFEVFIPMARLPAPEGGYEFGIGDIEIRPIKYSLVTRPDFVVTTATAVTLPTGNEARGLGEGNTVLTQYLLIDKAFGNWYVGANFGADTRIRGEDGSGIEYGAVVSYSFIDRGAMRGGFAPVQPSQTVVFSPSFEWVRSKRVSGPDDGEQSTIVVPGITAWWPKTGWQLHAGVAIPRSETREAERVYLLQLGNHLNWSHWF